VKKEEDPLKRLKIFNNEKEMKIPLAKLKTGLPTNVNWYKEGKVTRPYNQ